MLKDYKFSVMFWKQIVALVMVAVSFLLTKYATQLGPDVKATIESSLWIVVPAVVAAVAGVDATGLAMRNIEKDRDQEGPGG